MRNKPLPFAALFALGFVPALVLTYAIFNPEGFSYNQNVLQPLWKDLSRSGTGAFKTFSAVHAFIGVCLMIGIVYFARQVENFVGFTGLLLSIAFFCTFYWMLIEQKLFASPRLSAHLILILLSLFLATSIAWPKYREASQPPPQESTPPESQPSQPVI